MLVSKYFASSDPRIDVGFSEIVQGCDGLSGYTKPHVSVEDHLRARYILLVNGNEKASGLNWVMASNSVPFMIDPDRESWMLESSLQAWVHNVPVQPDFSDLSSLLDWAAANPENVTRIADAGKEYMHMFTDPTTEANIEGAVSTAYLDRVDIVTGATVEDTLRGSCQSEQ